MKRFTLYLPDEVYESTRQEAFDKKVPMNTIVVSKLIDEHVKKKTAKYIEDTYTQTKAKNVKDFINTPIPKTEKLCRHGFVPSLCKMWDCKHGK